MRNEWTPDEIVGRNIADLRRATGLSQNDLARDLQAVGFPWHRDTVSQIEVGKRRLSLDELAAVAAYFDLPVRALVRSPAAVGKEQVAFGEQAIPVATWDALWRDWDSEREPVPTAEKGLKPSHRRAIDAVFKGIRRPWALIWRKRAGEPGPAFVDAREEVLGKRSRYPGPIFVAGGERPGTTGKPYTTKVLFPPWWEGAAIRVEPDAPYVARDEAEVKALEQAEHQGFVRRITRAQAHYMRQKRKGGKS